jgi:hypothetical protein
LAVRDVAFQVLGLLGDTALTTIKKSPRFPGKKKQQRLNYLAVSTDMVIADIHGPVYLGMLSSIFGLETRSLAKFLKSLYLKFQYNS